MITQEEAQRAVAGFTNRSLTLDQIRDAGEAIARLYTNIGRMAQAVVPPQEIHDGIVEIHMIEGRVGNVIIELDPQSPSRLHSEIIQKYIAANNPADSLIDMNGLERSLTLLNEIAGNASEANLNQGKQDKTSDIVVSARDTGLFTGRVDASNYGANNTGVAQIITSLNLNNSSGLGDQVSLDVIGSEGSVYGLIKYAIPIGYVGWRLAGGVSALNYQSLSSFSVTSSKGAAQTYGLYSSYALERSAFSNKSFALNFENKNYDNYTNGTQSSNYQINNLSIGLNGNNYLNQNYLSWGAILTGGYLSISNANQVTQDSLGAATKGYFGKLSFNGSYMQALSIDKTQLNTSIYGQLANKNLNSAEQFYLGGPYGVRAYPVSQGGGSQGAILSVELMHALDAQWILGTFFDAGLIEQYKNTYPNWRGQTNAGNVYPLYSTGLLAKYSYQQVQISGVLAFRVGNNPLYNQSGQQLNVSNQYNEVQGWIKASLFF